MKQYPVLMVLPQNYTLPNILGTYLGIIITIKDTKCTLT